MAEEGYDPNRVSKPATDNQLQNFLEAPITGDLCERQSSSVALMVNGESTKMVPSIAGKISGLLGEGEGEDSIKNTFQLIGKFLVLRGSKEDGKLIDCVEHCDKFYWWLKSKQVHGNNRGRIVQCIAEKVNLSYPGIYDVKAWDP